MADKRSEYLVPIGGVDHAFLLTEEDAEKYPDAKKSSNAAKKIAEEQVKAVQAANKALQAQTKSGDE